MKNKIFDYLCKLTAFSHTTTTYSVKFVAKALNISEYIVRKWFNG